MEANYDEINGLKFTWNILPSNKADATKIVVPVGFHYTPLKKIDNLQLLEYNPLSCSHCKSINNPYFQRNIRGKFWECSFCKTRNNFPSEYSQYISETNLPIELLSENSTVEYKLNKKDANWPIFLFVIDIAISELELNDLKETIQQVLTNLPQDCQIGIITFGTMCNVHEIGFGEFPISYTFKGDKSYKSIDIQEQLGLIQSKNIQQGHISYNTHNKFIVPLRDCEYTINTFLDDLQVDAWPRKQIERQGNSAGLAINIAVSMLEGLAHGDPSRIMVFLGGAPNIGDGQIVGRQFSETIRNYVDFDKGNANTKYYKSALEFYNQLAIRASKGGQTIDLFSCSLNQVGLYEMKECVEKTGGYMLLTDSFSTMLFKDSFKKIFELDEYGNLKMNFRATVQVNTSNPVRVSGALGLLNSMNIKGSNVSDIIDANGGTNTWNLGYVDSNSTYTFLLDVNATTPVKNSIIQILTNYIAGDRSHRLRVTTTVKEISLPLTSENSFDIIGKGFDQEAACVMIARLCVIKGYTEDKNDILKWVDKTLIRLITKFAKYQKDNILSFKLSQQFNYFPQFIFYLRRSQFILNFNASPDEITNYKNSLMHENVVNATIMIQPILFSYSPEKPEATPVFLEIDSMKIESVLLLDAFFFIVIWHGESVCAWRDEGYHNDPEYENIKLMLESPIDYAQSILADRLPIPRFVSCDSGTPQERLLKCLVNPSSSSGKSKVIEDGYVSEDVSLKVFMDYLIKIVVSS